MAVTLALTELHEVRKINILLVWSIILSGVLNQLLFCYCFVIIHNYTVSGYSPIPSSPPSLLPLPAGSGVKEMGGGCGTAEVTVTWKEKPDGKSPWTYMYTYLDTFSMWHISASIFVSFSERSVLWYHHIYDFANIFKALIGTNYLSMAFAIKQSGLGVSADM